MNPDSINQDTYYIMQGSGVVFTAPFKNEIEARAHFGAWVTKNGKLDHIYSLVQHVVTVSMVAQPTLQKHVEPPKLEHFIRPASQS